MHVLTSIERTTLAPLHSSKQFKVIRLLLSAGANPTLLDTFGESPLSYITDRQTDTRTQSKLPEDIPLLLEGLATAPVRARLLYRARCYTLAGVGVGAYAQGLGLIAAPRAVTETETEAEEEGGEQTEGGEKLRAVLAYVLDVVEVGGSGGGGGNGGGGGRRGGRGQGMIQTNFVDLMEMVLPAWDLARF